MRGAAIRIPKTMNDIWKLKTKQASNIKKNKNNLICRKQINNEQ
jgi:hypothetical protein